MSLDILTISYYCLFISALGENVIAARRSATESLSPSWHCFATPSQMRHLGKYRIGGLVGVLLLTFAFAIGGAVRPSASVAEARLDALALAGFSLDDLCNDQTSHDARCSLCNLLSGGDLPSLTGILISLDRQLVASVILPDMQRAALRPRDPAVPLRGPPALPV